MMSTTRTRYGFSLETKEEHSSARTTMRSTTLDEPCSRVFDVTKEEPASSRRLHLPINGEKRRRETEGEREVDGWHGVERGWGLTRRKRGCTRRACSISRLT